MSELQMRVSDEDRERAAQQLQRAFTEGRLSHPELEDRLGLTFAARTYGDLLAVISDLPPDRQAPPPVEDVVLLESKNGHIKRTGDWAVPRHLRVISKYGSVELDLSQAAIPHPVVEVELRLKYGSARIVLPEGAAANIDRFRTGHGSAASDVPGRPRSGELHVLVTGESNYGHLAVRYPRRRWFTQ